MADNVPAFDDIPSFDDLPDAAAPQGGAPAAHAGAVPKFDDIPDFDALPDRSSQQGTAGEADPRASGVAPEGAFATGVREAAHAVIPAVAGTVAAGAGAVLGAAAGTAVAPGPGTIAGGLGGGAAGFIGGSMAADALQERALRALGFDDSQQRAANAEANPKSAFVGGLAPALATMNPVAAGETLGARAVQRGVGAVAMGGFEAGSEYVQTGEVDPTKVAIAAGAGAVFPSVNRVGAKLHGAGARLVPGRPGRTANPAAEQAHADVDDTSVETAVGDSVLAQSPPEPTGETTGNPASAPVRSPRVYAKQSPQADPNQARYAEALADPEAMRQFAFDEGITEAEAREIAQANYEPTQGDMLTQGQMDPATSAALAEASPAPAPAAEPAVPAPPPPPAAPTPVGPNAAKPRISLKRPVQPEPVVDAGFPKPGEPVAVGENEATPLPADMPERAAKAIARSKSSGHRPTDLLEAQQIDKERQWRLKEQPDNEVYQRDAAQSAARLKELSEPEAAEKPMPELKGETPINDSVTDAQKAAGNYPKARTMDFGKPVRIETHEGDIRRSLAGHPEPWENVSPYDYGYFGKTKGPDGDPIDVARPKAGSPDLGDKHFIIDQKDAATGKYDEPKVFTYFKDEATARDAFNRGFSDGKGPDRLHAITEVSRDGLVKYLAKHTLRAPKGPYGAPMPKEATQKPVKERAVVKDLVEKLKAQGKDTEAEKLLALPDEQVAKAIEGKRTRKYGVGTGASAGYPVEGLLNDQGKPVTANTKAEAQKRSDIHNAVRELFGVNKYTAAMEKGEALDKLKKGFDVLHSYDVFKANKLQLFGKGAWAPTYKPAEWLWAREAKKLMSKPTPGQWDKFKEADRLLRGGPDSVDAYRGGNRVEADISKSRRSGDEAVTAAEAKQHLAGTNAEEDAILDAIDRQRAGKGKEAFDVPHEEAESMVEPTPVRSRADLKELPHRTVDVGDSELARIDTSKITKEVNAAAAKRKAEAAALAGKKSSAANVAAEDKAGSAVRQIKINDPEEVKRLVELAAKASKRTGGIEVPETTEPRAPKRTVQDLFDRFANDEAGTLNLAKIKADLDAALKPSEPDSYIAREAREPSANYTRSLSESLHKIAQEDKSHRVGLLQEAKSLPKELNNPKTLEKIYLAREAGKLSTLTPEELELYDKHLKPVLDQNEQFVANIRKLDPDRMGPDVLNHISRIQKGDTSAYNMLKDSDDPTGPGVNALSVNADAAKLRKFVALENVATGQRYVISPTDKGFTLWNKYKRTQIKDPNFEFEAGQKYTVQPNKPGGKPVDYIMRDALTPEIEANARGGDGSGKPMRYYHNAALSAYMANAQLGSMARHLAELARISETPEFKKMSTKNPGKAAERGWQESKLPNFKGTFFDPQLRYVLDDYAKPGFDTPELWRNLNQAVTKTLFWTPTAHMANVGAHWFVGRGWDWIKPSGMRSLAVDGAKAIKSVISQDELQQELRRAGAGTISGGVITRKFIDKVGKAVGESIEKDPSKWGPIADKVGLPLKTFANAIYDGSSKVMWAANDMFLTQRILELERKGVSRQQAIIQAERDIPNYRLPTTIMGSGKYARFFQQVMADPGITSFGRYHYGVWNSYANIVKDAVGRKATLGDRVDAVGKMFAMGILAYAVYPVLDQMAQLVTGNKDASENRRGPLAIPHHVLAALQGKEDVMGAARSTMTVTPLTSTILETIGNKDFRGKPIVEPGDVRAAAGGSGKAAGRVAIQEGEHAVRGLISPYSTMANAMKKGLNPAEGVRDQLLDVKNPSARAVRYEQKVPITTFRNANARFKQGGSGPLEGLYDKMLGR